MNKPPTISWNVTKALYALLLILFPAQIICSLGGFLDLNVELNTEDLGLKFRHFRNQSLVTSGGWSTWKPHLSKKQISNQNLTLVEIKVTY